MRPDGVRARVDDSADSMKHHSLTEADRGKRGRAHRRSRIPRFSLLSNTKVPDRWREGCVAPARLRPASTASRASENGVVTMSGLVWAMDRPDRAESGRSPTHATGFQAWDWPGPGLRRPPTIAGIGHCSPWMRTAPSREGCSASEPGHPDMDPKN